MFLYIYIFIYILVYFLKNFLTDTKMWKYIERRIIIWKKI